MKEISEATIPLQNTGSTVESEIINNEDNEITDVKVLGTFPTEGAKEGNNLDVTVGEVKVTGAENAKVYYSENENATNDLENKDNNWTETITDGKKVKKYLVEIPTLATKQNVGTSYEMKADNLEYNQTAQEGYDVSYNSLTTPKTLNVASATVGTEKKVDEGISLTLSKDSEGPDTLENKSTTAFFLEVANKSNEKIENLNVTLNMPSEIEITDLFNEGDEVELNNNNFTVPEIGANSSVTIMAYIQANTTGFNETSKNVSITATSTRGDLQSESNKIDYTLENTNKQLTLDVSSDNAGQYVKAGDKIQYKIVVKNTSNQDMQLVVIKNWLPNGVTLDSITRNETELSEEDYVLQNDDTKGKKEIELDEDEIKVGETITYVITVEPDISYNEGKIIKLEDEIELIYGSEVINTAKISHTLETSESEVVATNGNGGNSNTNNNSNNENGNSSNNQNSNSSLPTYAISGTVWVDEDKNGQKDAQETELEGVKVRLLDAKTNEYAKDSNGNVIETTTNSEGFYSFSKVPQGEYLVVFEYNTTAYSATTFEKEGVVTENNSKAIEKDLTIDGKTAKYGTSEKINLTQNVANINLGLVTNKTYDMQLDKYVSKITVQNSKTVSKDYGDAKLAKQEINAKEVNSTTVVVEYTIRITNKGDVAGYVKKVADYLSSDYKFNSELNKDWYQENGVVYSTSLANTKINPGESKDLKLTVIKQMKESNVGLVNNTAEIVSSYNELGLKDVNSTEGNKVQGENDMSSANVIIAIKTGQIVMTVALVIATVALIVIALVIIEKKHTTKEDF